MNCSTFFDIIRMRLKHKEVKSHIEDVLNMREKMRLGHVNGISQIQPAQLNQQPPRTQQINTNNEQRNRVDRQNRQHTQNRINEAVRQTNTEAANRVRMNANNLAVRNRQLNNALNTLRNQTNTFQQNPARNLIG